MSATILVQTSILGRLSSGQLYREPQKTQRERTNNARSVPRWPGQGKWPKHPPGQTKSDRPFQNFIPHFLLPEKGDIVNFETWNKTRLPLFGEDRPQGIRNQKNEPVFLINSSSGSCACQKRSDNKEDKNNSHKVAVQEQFRRPFQAQLTSMPSFPFESNGVLNLGMQVKESHPCSGSLWG
jgi:hypothetical protein